MRGGAGAAREAAAPASATEARLNARMQNLFISSTSMSRRSGVAPYPPMHAGGGGTAADDDDEYALQYASSLVGEQRLAPIDVAFVQRNAAPSAANARLTSQRRSGPGPGPGSEEQEEQEQEQQSLAARKAPDAAETADATDATDADADVAAPAASAAEQQPHNLRRQPLDRASGALLEHAKTSLQNFADRVRNELHARCPTCSASCNEEELEHWGECGDCHIEHDVASVAPPVAPTQHSEFRGYIGHQQQQLQQLRQPEQAQFYQRQQQPATGAASSPPLPSSSSNARGEHLAAQRVEKMLIMRAPAPGTPRRYTAAGGSAPTSMPPDGWYVPASQRATRTVNPIRNLVQSIDVAPNPDKPVIHLSVGDPCVFGNLRPPAFATRAMVQAIDSGKHNGYTLSMGSEAARAAVAARYSPAAESGHGADGARHRKLTAKDVFLTSGTSGALELALGALLDEGDNVLAATPGFPLVRTIVEHLGAYVREYKLQADKQWQVDLAHLRSLADGRTRALVVNNPSNPCGSVWPREHMQEILAAAAELRLPIVADEVYADMVFAGALFHSFGELAADVPVVAVGGLSKQLTAPGWRLGWVLVHDRQAILERAGYRRGLQQLTTRMLIPNALAQAALPDVLGDRARHLAAVRALMDTLEQHARFTMQALGGDRAPGLTCIEPQGSMYLMARVDTQRLAGIRDSMDFCRELLREESVFVLPGECFGAEASVRIVFCAPMGVLSEAYARIRQFCARRSGGV